MPLIMQGKIMDIKYINNTKTTKIINKNAVEYITFNKLNEAGVVHGFSTRLGGVSQGYLGTMNLSFCRGDDRENVMENHRRFSEAVGYDYKRLVFSDQVHKTEIRQVNMADAGKGIIRVSDITETDGLMTDVPGLPLITFYADCVPVFFYDKRHRVVAVNHSGWKGTVANISSHMVDKLNKIFSTNPEDLICAIGPSICRSCYEVSEDVAQQFKSAYTEMEYNRMITEKGNGKYLLDLHMANLFNLINSGVPVKNIDVTDICTCCNPDYLFSHRASHGMRGNLAAVIMIPEV